MLTIKIKNFNELTKNELYKILQLRNDIFIVEQNCPYLDVDGKDLKAYHVIGYKENAIVAYTRIFKPNDYFEEASIGRVLVVLDERKHKYGYDIMEASINAIEDLFDTKIIKISAQKHLKQFYLNLGFKQKGISYLEDNIPHISMLKK